jgi:hypothetical protein
MAFVHLLLVSITYTVKYVYLNMGMLFDELGQVIMHSQRYKHIKDKR